MNNTLEQSLRQYAYTLQRTGNPRCEAEAMEIHKKLDGCPLCNKGWIGEEICSCMMDATESENAPTP